MIKKKQYDLPFEKTDFVSKVSKMRGEIIGRSTEIVNGKVEQKIDYKETEQDEYISSVAKPMTNIIFTFEQLEFIPVFMRRFPGRKFHNEYGINHPKYLQYHLENHFLKITTVLDQCIAFTAEIYRLGIPIKLNSLRHLSENKHTRQTKSVELLKKLDKQIQDIKGIRNRIMHRGEFNDSEIDRVAQFYFLSNTVNEGEEPMFSEDTLKYHMKDAVKNRLELVESNTTELKKYITKLFSLSLIEFETKIQTFRK
ncbi:Cthe_2314 family HEPN domain-containing protein [Lacinutrix mariniflava]|uniref:Cthe_2314 family HEPN domain-containing protein n=1 Tax=Lacinutrix mariniflava TaxID=342955 RepID=UPI0006E24C11|nr:Cthe_2314 family HEPN domain-containing protein [Lacinutrix mariniflava]